MSAWLTELSVRLWPDLLVHLWQTTVFVLALLPVLYLLRRSSARVRHSIYLVASLKFLLPAAWLGAAFSGLATDFSQQLSWLRVLVPDPSGLLAWIGGWFSTPGALGQGESPSFGGLYAALTAVWFAGFITLASAWWIRQRRFGRRIAAARRVKAGPEHALLEGVRKKSGVRREVELAMLEGVAETGVWRIWRPVLVLPAEMPRHLSRGEFESLLAHEMAHVRRWDNLVANLHMVLCCVFWFHPFVWLLDRRLLAEREKACDEQVVELLGGADTYARGLVKAIRFGLGIRLAGLSSASSCDLRQRIERIRSGRLGTRASASDRLWLPAVATLLLVFTLGAGAAGPQFAPARPEAAPRYEPDRCAKAKAAESESRLAIPDEAPDLGDCLGWRRGDAAAS